MIARSGAFAGAVSRWMGPLFLTDAFSVHPRLDILTTGFLYYLLQSQQDALHDMKAGGGVPHVRVKEVEAYKVPVPPVSVQRAIVDVLDRFTELEAELEARRHQYEHYLSQLFLFRDQREVQWLPMGEVGEFTRGRRFTKDDVVESGLPSIHYGEIYTRYGTAATTTFSHVRAELAPRLRFAQPRDVVVAAVGETVEDVGKAVAWIGEGGVAVHDDCFVFRHPLDPKFVSYYLQTRVFHAEKAKYVARAKVKRLSGESLSKMVVPVPPVAEQERVVSILDSFDALVNDLSVSLPAELKARRQQYEYYRDKLLSFEEAPA